MVDKERPRTYYDRPVVKEPIWTWEIPWYFMFGGLGGASATLAYAAERSGNEELAKWAWVNALAGMGVSPLLLTSDLGRPMRFLNMLRVFKVTSPMSLGSWLLTANILATAPATVGSATGRFQHARRLFRPVSALLGPAVATYTAALVSNTAIPVWSEARLELPFVFAAGSAASAGAAAAAVAEPKAAGPARRLAIGGAVAELATEQVMEWRLGELGEPYHKGPAGRYAKAARALTGAGAVVLAAGGRRRMGAVAGAALTLAGVTCLRWSVFKAGSQSAADPRYTVGPQRERAASDGAVSGRR